VVCIICIPANIPGRLFLLSYFKTDKSHTNLSLTQRTLENENTSKTATFVITSAKLYDTNKFTNNDLEQADLLTCSATNTSSHESNNVFSNDINTTMESIIWFSGPFRSQSHLQK